MAYSIRAIAFGLLVVGCADGEDWIDEPEDEAFEVEDLDIVGDPLLPGQCKKIVHLHLANWAAADPLDDPRASVAPNGCWTFDMAHEYGHYWAHCKGAMNKGTNYPNTWIANWGSPSTWEPGGPKMWVYNETRKDRSPYPSDSEGDVRVRDVGQLDRPVGAQRGGEARLRHARVRERRAPPCYPRAVLLSVVRLRAAFAAFVVVAAMASPARASPA